MRTTVDLPDELFRKAKAKAAIEGITLKELLVRALEGHLHEAESFGHGDLPVPPIPGVGKPIRLSGADIERLLVMEEIEKYGRS